MTVKRIDVKVSEDMYGWLKAESKKRGLPMGVLVAFALENRYQQFVLRSNLSTLKELAE